MSKVSPQTVSLIIFILLIIGIPILLVVLQNLPDQNIGAEVVEPRRVVVSNKTDTSATITWVTEGSKSTTLLEWGTAENLGSSATDYRDADAGTTTARYTHIVQLSGLTAGTTYYYRIKQGEESFPNSQGAPYAFTTFSTAGTTSSQTLSVFGSLDNYKDDSIVYVVPQSGANTRPLPLSAIPLTDGSWYITLTSTRYPDGTMANLTDASTIDVVLDSGIAGTITSATPKQSPVKATYSNALDTLQSENVLRNGIGTTSASTDVPSVVLPTMSPTPTVTIPMVTFRIDVPLTYRNRPSVTPSQATPPPFTGIPDAIFNTYGEPSISNISDTTLSFLWLTTTKINSEILYGTSASNLGNTKADDRDTSTPSQYLVHHVTLNTLNQNTSYYFSFDGGRTVKTVSTPISLSGTPSVVQLRGKITNVKGECFIRSQVSSGTNYSSVITTVASPTGDWTVDIGKIRKADLSDYYNPSDTDTITFNVYCVAGPTEVYGITTAIPVKTAKESETLLTVSTN